MLKNVIVLLAAASLVWTGAGAADVEDVKVSLSGGRVVRIFNTRAPNREVAARLSADGGRTWSKTLVLDAERIGLSGFATLVARLQREDPKLWRDLHFLPNVCEMLRDGEETVDGCHPNDRGMKELGIAFGDKFKEILGI